MDKKDFAQHQEIINSCENYRHLQNILRILTMLEKALGRLARRNWYSRREYPEIFCEIEAGIETMRSWMRNYQIFANVPNFSFLLIGSLQELFDLIGLLILNCHPSKGRRRRKKNKKTGSISSFAPQ